MRSTTHSNTANDTGALAGFPLGSMASFGTMLGISEEEEEEERCASPPR